MIFVKFRAYRLVRGPDGTRIVRKATGSVFLPVDKFDAEYASEKIAERHPGWIIREFWEKEV